MFYRVDYTLAVMFVGSIVGALFSGPTASVSPSRFERGYYVVVVCLLVLRTGAFAGTMLMTHASSLRGVLRYKLRQQKATHNHTVREPFLLIPRIPGMFRSLAVVCLLAVSLFVTVAPAQQAPPAKSLPNGIVWSPSLTGKSPMGSAAFDGLYADMEKEQHHDLKGIVIVQNGALLSEHYFNGDSATTLHDIRSATKSLTSLLMGIAIDNQVVHGVDESISQYLPGLPQDGKEKITIKDLLNMRSGLDADDEDPATPGNENRLDESSDWIKSVYAIPMKRTPGEKYLYCSVNAFLTGVIVENAAKTPLDDFARINLFGPLNIQNFRWRHIPVNRTTGQGNLEITARSAAALGQLMLNDGVVDGKRLVSHDWVTASLANQVPISDSDPYSDFYGYMWYTKAEPVGDHKVLVHFASGNGGNKIYIVPSFHMVVAITSSAYGTRWGQQRSQDVLLRILSATTTE